MNHTWRAKLCWWYLFRSLWSSRTQNPLVAEESLFKLNSFTIVNKENHYSKCVLNIFHISWFDEYLWLSTLYTVYLTCPIYMYKLALEDLLFIAEGETSLKSLEEKQSERRQSLDQPSWIGWVYTILLFPFFTLKLIAYKF